MTGLQSRRRRLSGLIACCFGVAALAAGLTQPAMAGFKAGRLDRGTLSFQERERSYFFHLPSGRKMPLHPAVLFALHGGGKAEGDDYARRTGYNKIADRDGFIVVYPNGVDAQWNDGRGATFRGVPDNGAVDDVGYISKLIDVFVSRYGADPARVYVEGSSNGGMMTQRVACELSDKVAAVASVISTMPKNVRADCVSKRALTVLIMDATTDPFVPWDGGFVSPFGRRSGEVISAWDTVHFWATRDGCVGQPKANALPDRDKRDHSSVTKFSYRSCADGTQVVLYKVSGAGHSRPGMIGRVPERLLGPKNGDIDASDEIWRFVSRFRR